jgi:hypothetical protein
MRFVAISALFSKMVNQWNHPDTWYRFLLAIKLPENLRNVIPVFGDYPELLLGEHTPLILPARSRK